MLTAEPEQHSDAKRGHLDIELALANSLSAQPHDRSPTNAGAAAGTNSTNSLAALFRPPRQIAPAPDGAAEFNAPASDDLPPHRRATPDDQSDSQPATAASAAPDVLDQAAATEIAVEFHDSE